MENAKLAAEVPTFEAECNSNGNLFWLGATTKDFDVMIRDANQKLVRGNFSNWNSPLFWGDYKCVYIFIYMVNGWHTHTVTFLSCVLSVDLLEHQSSH